MKETQILPLGGEDPLEEEMAAYSSVPAWRIRGQRSPVDHSPQGFRVQLTVSFCLSLHLTEPSSNFRELQVTLKEIRTENLFGS